MHKRHTFSLLEIKLNIVSMKHGLHTADRSKMQNVDHILHNYISCYNKSISPEGGGGWGGEGDCSLYPLPLKKDGLGGNLGCLWGC